MGILNQSANQTKKKKGYGWENFLDFKKKLVIPATDEAILWIY